MAMEKHDLWSTSVDADHLAPQMLLEMLPNCFSQVFTMTFPKKSLACEGPLLAESGPSFQRFLRFLNVRFREKQTFNMKRNRLVPRRNGHQMYTWGEFEATDVGRIRPNVLI